MTQFLIFLIIGVVGIAAGYYLALKRKVRGGVLLAKQNEAMEANTQKLREYARGKDRIMNNDESGT